MTEPDSPPLLDLVLEFGTEFCPAQLLRREGCDLWLRCERALAPGLSVQLWPLPTAAAPLLELAGEIRTTTSRPGAAELEVQLDQLLQQDAAMLDAVLLR